MLSRLAKWWETDPEQIGGKAGQSCIDHILTLQILINIARTKKSKLFILFVDFSKAYDRVSRSRLLTLLKETGCGRLLLRAIIMMYKGTQLLYENVTILTNTGVKQGSPSSGFLFTFFINPLIRLFKELGSDGFLQDLHCLLMMDDSVILATSRERFQENINVLMKFCGDYGITVNEAKTKFMVINHELDDRNPIIAGPNLTIKYTEKYIYLGAVITHDGNICTVMKEHAALKNAHYLKFVAFIKKNSFAPFYVKRQVFRACIISTLLYSCEVWFSNCVDRSIIKIYMSCVKAILGVRDSTDNDLCLHEIMMPSVESLIQQTQLKYLRNVIDNPDKHHILLKVMGMARNVQLPSGHITKCKAIKYIDRIIEENDNKRMVHDMENRKSRIALSTKTKSLIYKEYNPVLAVHDVYITRKYFPEHWRISWTRFRLSSTNLPCEKNRWTQCRGIELKCVCGEPQTEKHILITCNERINRTANIEDIFQHNDQRHTMKVIYDTLQKFEVV